MQKGQALSKLRCYSWRRATILRIFRTVIWMTEAIALPRLTAERQPATTSLYLQRASTPTPCGERFRTAFQKRGLEAAPRMSTADIATSDVEGLLPHLELYSGL